MLRRDSNNLGGKRQLLRRVRPAEEHGPPFPRIRQGKGQTEWAW